MSLGLNKREPLPDPDNKSPLPKENMKGKIK